MSREALEAEVEELEDSIRWLEGEIDSFELDPDYFEEAYDEVLDEGGEVNIGGFAYDPSFVLKKVDPMAYRCGLVDYVGSMKNEESDDYKTMVEELEEMKESLREKEEELEEMEADDEE